MAFTIQLDILPPKCAIDFVIIKGESYVVAKRLSDDLMQVLLVSKPYGPVDTSHGAKVELTWANFEWEDT